MSTHDPREGRNPSPRILVVDDDPGIRLLFTSALESAGYETVAVADAHAAVDHLDGSIAAVILDNHLPDLDGTELLAHLRGDPHYATLPVLLVTGDDQLEQRVAGLDAGATDYLVKPVEREELVARVGAHLRGQAAWFGILDGRLRDRADLVSTLFSIAPRSSAEDTALAICERLLQAEEVAGAALTRLDDGGRLRLLAARGNSAFTAALHQLTSAPASYLRERAEHPWIERTPAHVAAAVRLAVAPLRLGGSTVGLLALGVSPEGVGPLRDIDHILAEAIDYAGVATGLLGLSLHARSERDRRLSSISEIIDTGSFTPAFQPIVDLSVSRTVGYEALTRFEDGSHPELCFVEAARLGIGIALELETMASAIEASTVLPSEHYLSLNVSAELIIEHGAKVSALARKAHREIVLELTEHDAVEDYVALRAALDRLHPPVRVSVDDAGAGFASLRHVIMLRPEYVKLDRSWVKGIHADPTRQAMVAGLAHFARATGCHLVAEGIEQQAERDTLVGLEVPLGQGFLLGRPAVA